MGYVSGTYWFFLGYQLYLLPTIFLIVMSSLHLILYFALFSFQGSFETSKKKFVVGLGRLELPTSRLSGVRSNRLSYKPILNYMVDTFVSNGDGEIRTLDPLLARQVLSQLSYAPVV